MPLLHRGWFAIRLLCLVLIDLDACAEKLPLRRKSTWRRKRKPYVRLVKSNAMNALAKSRNMKSLSVMTSCSVLSFGKLSSIESENRSSCIKVDRFRLQNVLLDEVCLNDLRMAQLEKGELLKIWT
jgi:hypothetical protein